MPMCPGGTGKAAPVSGSVRPSVGSRRLRTISVTAETASYTAAQQTTDFGSTQSTIYFKVYQVSAQVGRGYALTDQG